MQLTKTLLFALVGTAFASPIEKRQLSVIQSAVTSVQGALTKLNTAVQGVGNDAASAQPILAASTEVQDTLTKAATDIQGAQSLQLQEALGLQQTATDLTSSATTLIDSLVSKKSNFDQIGVSSVVLQNLQQQKTASASLGTAIVSKVPAIGQGIAQQSIDQITAALDKGIQAFSAGAKPARNTTAPPAAAPAKPKTPAAAPAAPKTPAAAPKAPAGGIEGLLGGLLGDAGGAGGANGAGGLGALLGGLTGGAAGGAAGAGGAGGAGGIGALLGGLTGGAAGGATGAKANVVDFAEDAAEEDEE